MLEAHAVLCTTSAVRGNPDYLLQALREHIESLSLSGNLPTSGLCQSRFCCARSSHSINASSFQLFSKTTKSTTHWRFEDIKYFNIVCLKKCVKMIFSWRSRSSKVIAVIKLLLSCLFLYEYIYKKYISEMVRWHSHLTSIQL